MRCFNESENGILFSMAQLPYKGFCNYETLWVLLLVQQTCKAGDTSITSNRPISYTLHDGLQQDSAAKKSNVKEERFQGRSSLQSRVGSHLKGGQWPSMTTHWWSHCVTPSHSDRTIFNPFQCHFQCWLDSAEMLLMPMIQWRSKEDVKRFRRRSFLSIATWQPL